MFVPLALRDDVRRPTDDRVNGPIFTLRFWRVGDGNAGSPEHVNGIAVTRRLCRRPDEPGALVGLADRRYALTGALIAVGAANQLQRFLRRRTALSRDADERAWLQAAAEALAEDLRRRERPLL